MFRLLEFQNFKVVLPLLSANRLKACMFFQSFYLSQIDLTYGMDRGILFLHVSALLPNCCSLIPLQGTISSLPRVHITNPLFPSVPDVYFAQLSSLVNRRNTSVCLPSTKWSLAIADLSASLAGLGISVAKHCLSSAMMQSHWHARTYNLTCWTTYFVARMLFSPIQCQEQTSQRCHSGIFISQPCIIPVNVPRSWRRRCLRHLCSVLNSQRYRFWQMLEGLILQWHVRLGYNMFIRLTDDLASQFFPKWKRL